MAMWSLRQMRAVFSMRDVTPSYAQFIVEILRQRHFAPKDGVGKEGVKDSDIEGEENIDHAYDNQLFPEEQLAREHLTKFVSWDDDAHTM